MSPRVRLLPLHLLLLRGREVRLEPDTKPLRSDRAKQLGHGMRSCEAKITSSWFVSAVQIGRVSMHACGPLLTHTPLPDTTIKQKIAAGRLLHLLQDAEDLARLVR